MQTSGVIRAKITGSSHNGNITTVRRAVLPSPQPYVGNSAWSYDRGGPEGNPPLAANAKLH